MPSDHEDKTRRARPAECLAAVLDHSLIQTRKTRGMKTGLGLARNEIPFPRERQAAKSHEN